MTTNPKARKFRIRRSSRPTSDQVQNSAPQREGTAQPQAQQSPASSASASDDRQDAARQLDAIRQEGLTGRQLRMARRVAQKYGIAATSDFDAVRQLRARGINPFEKANLLDIVSAQSEDAPSDTEARVQLPRTTQQPGRELALHDPRIAAEQRASEIRRVQQDIARRRKRRLIGLFARLSAFVFLPTILAGYYFYIYATPMYATNTEFVIQQAEPATGGGAGGLGGLFQGTSMATQQDSITVQSYLTSRAAMLRLDEEHGFKEHFSNPAIDPLQRLPDGATNEEAFKIYADRVQLGYDPTEGIVKMEVVAADPETSQRFSEALVGYAEEQVDHLTQRLREDQMKGAMDSYAAAEDRRSSALNELLRIQNEVELIDPAGETAAVLSQISALETQRQQKVLELTTLQNARRPNQGRVQAVQSEIQGLETLIGELRAQMTRTNGDSSTLASKNTELRIAEENYQFQTVMVQQALAALEAARLEANRQVRYLSLGVEPIAPDQATYPRAFENTAIAFFIFSGIYLMISLTAAILREQVSS